MDLTASGNNAVRGITVGLESPILIKEWEVGVGVSLCVFFVFMILIERWEVDRFISLCV